MQKSLLWTLIVLASLLVGGLTAWAGGPALHALSQPAAPLGAAFTYQGQLMKNDLPVNDNTCSMTFTLWDSQSNGSGQIGGIQAINPVTVTAGVFTVQLNGGSQFGASPFNGQARWLQVGVHCAGDSTPTTLARQPLTAAPYALYSLSTGALQGRPVSTTAPVTGQALKWNGSAWSPSTIAAPLAFANVWFSGTVAAGTPNISVTFDVTDTLYEVTIAGETYAIGKYVTVVTPEIGCYAIPWVFANAGKLLIQFQPATGGAYDSCNFEFVTFKP